jgi:hypothetical protein
MARRSSRIETLGRMIELKLKTWRVRRGWFDRLRGYEQLYKTKVSDGTQSAYGRGPTRESSKDDAEKNWNKQFGKPTSD